MHYLKPGTELKDNYMIDLYERISPNQTRNYVFLDDFEGNKVKVKTYTPGLNMPSG